MVASGAADAGFGIEAAAKHFGLHFIPITWESYCLAVRRAALTRFAVSEFVSVLRSAEFMTQAGALPGYEACQAGAIAEVDSVIAYGELPQSGAR
jgi:putative molybdopterin biosynthesis protein